MARHKKYLWTDTGCLAGAGHNRMRNDIRFIFRNLRKPTRNRFGGLVLGCWQRTGLWLVPRKRGQPNENDLEGKAEALG